MPQLDSDTFTYSNGALASVSSAKWTKLSSFTDMTVLSNEAHGPAGNDGAAVITTWPGSTTNQYSQGVVSVQDDGAVLVRADAVGTFYSSSNWGANWRVYKSVAAVITELSTVAQTTANGDTVYMEVQGIRIVTKKNGGAAVNDFDDSAIASGKPGIHAWGNTTRVTSWLAGDFVVAALTGTAIAGGVTEAQIVAGSETIIITLTDDTFIAN